MLYRQLPISGSPRFRRDMRLDRGNFNRMNAESPTGKDEGVFRRGNEGDHAAAMFIIHQPERNLVAWSDAAQCSRLNGRMQRFQRYALLFAFDS